MTRLEILAKIDDLTDQHCKPCPDRPRGNQSLTKCHLCPIYNQLRECGDQLDELTRIKREAVPMECTKENYEMLKADGVRVSQIAHRLGVSTPTLYKRKKDWYSNGDETDMQTEHESGEKEVNADVKSKYIDQISDLNKQISSQREEHQKLVNDYEELSQQYAAAVKDKDEAVKQLTELQASKIDVDAMRALLKSLL